MPLPRWLLEQMKREGFWDDSLSAEAPPPEDEPRLVWQEPIRLAVGASAWIELNRDEHGTFLLTFLGAGEQEAELIAYEDPYCSAPHALRWEDVDLLGRVVALLDPTIPHPGPVVLLLGRFAPICLGEDSRVAVALLEEAWRRLGIASKKQIRRRIEMRDRRSAGFRWERIDGLGWMLVQDEDSGWISGAHVGGHRVRGAFSNDILFPFAAWESLLAEARQSCDERVSPWRAADGGALVHEAKRILENEAWQDLPGLGARLKKAGAPGAVASALLRQRPDTRVCWVLEELLGEGRGWLLAARGNASPELAGPRPVLQVSARLPWEGSGVSVEAFRHVESTLKDALDELGSVSCFIDESPLEGPRVLCAHASLAGDIGAAFAALVGGLRAAGASEETEMRWWAWQQHRRRLHEL